MTCEEVKAALMNDPGECTRAERAVIEKHLYNCQLCRPILIAALAGGIERLVAGDANPEMTKMAIADMSDPEYLEARWGNP